MHDCACSQKEFFNVCVCVVFFLPESPKFILG